MREVSCSVMSCHKATIYLSKNFLRSDSGREIGKYRLKCTEFLMNLWSFKKHGYIYRYLMFGWWIQAPITWLLVTMLSCLCGGRGSALVAMSPWPLAPADCCPRQSWGPVRPHSPSAHQQQHTTPATTHKTATTHTTPATTHNRSNNAHKSDNNTHNSDNYTHKSNNIIHNISSVREFHLHFYLLLYFYFY